MACGDRMAGRDNGLRGNGNDNDRTQGNGGNNDNDRMP